MTIIELCDSKQTLLIQNRNTLTGGENIFLPFQSVMLMQRFGSCMSSPLLHAVAEHISNTQWTPLDFQPPNLAVSLKVVQNHNMPFPLSFRQIKS